MDEHFAAFVISNATMLCIGGITRAEAEMAIEDGADIDGQGYYLFLASAEEPKQPIRLLAKFFSAMEAEAAARLFERHAPA